MYQNPDYPMPGAVGNFISSTYMAYEQPQGQQFAYYPGFGAAPQQEVDSRRTPPTQMFGYQPPVAAPTQFAPQQPQPFSAYGGSGMQMSAPLSSPMADSRRIPSGPIQSPFAPQFNAQKPQMVPVAPVAQPAPQWSWQMQPQQPQYMTADSRLVPLFAGAQVPTYDKRSGVWDNCFTDARALPQPTMYWNQTPTVQQQTQTFVPMSQMQTNMFQQQQMNRMCNPSWMEEYYGNRNPNGGF
jgi:hypothetical protein